MIISWLSVFHVVRLKSSLPREFYLLSCLELSGYLTALIEAYPGALAACISMFLGFFQCVSF